MIYGHFPWEPEAMIRFAILSALLCFSLSLCNFDATSDSKAQHENLFGSHLSSADTHSHAHTHSRTHNAPLHMAHY